MLYFEEYKWCFVIKWHDSLCFITHNSMGIMMITTTLSLGTIPFNMFIYSRMWVDDPTKMPWVNIAVTIVYMWIACILGFLVGRRWRWLPRYLTRVCRSNVSRSGIYYFMFVCQLFWFVSRRFYSFVVICSDCFYRFCCFVYFFLSSLLNLFSFHYHVNTNYSSRRRNS